MVTLGVGLGWFPIDAGVCHKCVVTLGVGLVWFPISVGNVPHLRGHFGGGSKCMLECAALAFLRLAGTVDFCVVCHSCLAREARCLCIVLFVVVKFSWGQVHLSGGWAMKMLAHQKRQNMVVWLRRIGEGMW